MIEPSARMNKIQDYDWMPEARQMAAQCWCEPETSGTEMDAALAEAVARRIAAWMQTGAFHARNEAYWCDRAHAAEAAQPAPAEPVSREHAIALRDAELCGCEDMYFAARPQIDTLQARRIYAAGFKAGYEVRPLAQPAPVPLTDEQIAQAVAPLYKDAQARAIGRIDDIATARAIERAHGIAASPQPAPVPLTLEERAMLRDAAHIINRAARTKGDHWDRVGSLLTCLADDGKSSTLSA